jgi:hypothetical protein
MPASGGDPVTAALRLSLAVNQDSEDNNSLDKRLIASAARVLLTRIEYEPHGNCFADVLNNLKNKCIVLRGQDTVKNGTDSATSSATLNMPGKVLVTCVAIDIICVCCCLIVCISCQSRL